MHSGGLRRSSISVANFKQLTPLCVLFPVLGIHFFLVPARPEHKSQYEHSYDLLLTISSSFQGKESRELLSLSIIFMCIFLGFTVSWLLCFLNKVIQHNIKGILKT